MFKSTLFTALFLSAITFYSGCSSTKSLVYKDEADLVRGNQYASIETAQPIEKGHPRISLSYQSTLVKPDSLVTNDTLEESSTTIINRMNQSRHTFSGSFTFPCMDILGAGVNVDISVGEVTKDVSKSFLNKNIFETSLFLILTGTINRVTIAYKPQVTYLSVNGIYSRNSSAGSSRNSQITERRFTLRNSVGLRVNLSKHFDIFAGGQHSIQPYKLINDRLEMENGYALYGGVGARLNKNISADLFILAPLKTDISNYRAPVQSGIKISTTF